MKGTGGMRRFRKKVRRFVRLYWFWVSLGLVLTKVSVEAAYIERGYKAYGGEWLVLPGHQQAAKPQAIVFRHLGISVGIS